MPRVFIRPSEPLKMGFMFKGRVKEFETLVLTRNKRASLGLLVGKEMSFKRI